MEQPRLLLIDDEPTLAAFLASAAEESVRQTSTNAAYAAAMPARRVLPPALSIRAVSGPKQTSMQMSS